MKFYLRIGFYILTRLFIIGIVLSVLGLTLGVFTYNVPPILGIGKVEENVIFITLFILISLFLYAIFFIWYMGKPLIYVMGWIKNLANKEYQIASIKATEIKRNEKLKRPYILYQEVFDHMQRLTNAIKENEREREKLNEFKREWGAGVSHDLKTPLTYIKSYSAMLLTDDYEWNDEEKERFITDIQKKASHLEELINDLNLSFQMDSEKIPINKTNHHFVEFLRRVVAEVANDPRSIGQNLSFSTSEDDIELSFDPKLLGRALYNLLINAVVHNPPNTIITISLFKDDQLRLIIKDDGIGMDEKTQKNLFNKYYRGGTTEQRSEGTGLGMLIARQLIKAHKGQIDVVSKLSEGTCIHLTFPLNN
ncbi:sensor histidine kinase [Priestia megaterium]|uniref:sensor histidine kinase n=1 Tax=Priestia megaterium TaxID=1404 RepID=UPI00366BC562